MLILGYSNSETNKNMMPKIWTNGVQLSDCGENIVRKAEIACHKKLLVTSNFLFTHNVFKSCLLLMRQNEYLWSKGLRGGKKKRAKMALDRSPDFLRLL